MRARSVYLSDRVYQLLEGLVKQGLFTTASEAIRFGALMALDQLGYLKTGKLPLSSERSAKLMTVSIRIPGFLADVASQLARELGYKSRSELIRHLLVQSLIRYAKEGER